jgi:hypothetical protein
VLAQEFPFGYLRDTKGEATVGLNAFAHRVIRELLTTQNPSHAPSTPLFGRSETEAIDVLDSDNGDVGARIEHERAVARRQQLANSGRLANPHVCHDAAWPLSDLEGFGAGTVTHPARRQPRSRKKHEESTHGHLTGMLVE